MAIQNRRGNYSDFDPTKLLPGEFAVVQTDDPNSSNGKAIYIAFAAGSVVRLSTVDDMTSALYAALSNLETSFSQTMQEYVDEASDLYTAKINLPVSGSSPTYGTVGQILQTNGDGTTSWIEKSSIIDDILVL